MCLFCYSIIEEMHQLEEAVEYVALFREAYRADHWRQDYFVSVQTISGIFHTHLAGVFRLHVASTCHKAHSSRRARQSTELQDSISALSSKPMRYAPPSFTRPNHDGNPSKFKSKA